MLTLFLRLKLPLSLMLVFLVACLACGGGGGSSSSVDLSENACDALGLKIFSGSQCSPQAASPVVSITATLIDGRKALCSGSLISPENILTAGHCLPEKGALVDTIEVSIGGQSIAADGFAVHPGYQEDNERGVIFSDVAVVHFNATINIQPLPLILSRDASSGDIIDIFGYGIDESGNVGTLRSGQMLLSDTTPSHLFAEFGDEGSNTCLGDSGGPALETLANGQIGIIGVTSTGDPDNLCARGDLSVFANLQEQSIISFLSTVVPGLRTI